LPDEPRVPERAEEVYAILKERIRRHTMGDSTSVPLDTAQRLLESILYCAELNKRFPLGEISPEAPLRARWQAGVQQARRIARRAKLLLLQAKRMPPPVVNTAYCDTIDALPAFFAGYDADFFAQEIPCSFDYPLCRPVQDSLLGAEYMREYLRCLLAESSFLRAFAPETLRALYMRYYIDYADLLVNLYLPAAEMATLCALAEEDVRALWLPPEKLARVGRSLASLEEDEAKKRMRQAVKNTLCALHLADDFLLHYMQDTALALLVRLRAAPKG
jgi:hypothetical protein